jgi:FkbM family methyltransferase
MNNPIKGFPRSCLRFFDIKIIKYSTFQELLAQREELAAKKDTADDIEFLQTLPSNHASQLLKTIQKSKSQYRQDLFVLSHLNFKREGFFVEFGATDGVDLSNTYLLEKHFGWNGILAEPAKCWHKSLKTNRSAHIDYNCVWSQSDSEISFIESGVLSTINCYSGADSFEKERARGRRYRVKTISLNDLLEKYSAPRYIDYLSVDTEGSEFHILNSLDFGRYNISVITCEHNYTSTRDKIFSLLTRNGYVRIYQNLSKCDDWYVKY